MSFSNEPGIHGKNLEALVEDTIFARCKRYQGSFSVNSAGWELRSASDAALPLIEKAIVEQVVPKAGHYVDHNALLSEFPGLLCLWMAYFVIGNHHGNVTRLVKLMSRLDGPVLGVAMLATTSVFRTIPKQAADDPIPPELLEFIREVAARSAGNDAELARHALKSLYRA